MRFLAIWLGITAAFSAGIALAVWRPLALAVFLLLLFTAYIAALVEEEL